MADERNKSPSARASRKDTEAQQILAPFYKLKAPGDFLATVLTSANRSPDLSRFKPSDEWTEEESRLARENPLELGFLWENQERRKSGLPELSEREKQAIRQRIEEGLAKHGLGTIEEALAAHQRLWTSDIAQERQANPQERQR
jgi:hypothetical protein